MNSTGVGALLTATGSTSVSTDDLVLSASQLPFDEKGILEYSMNPINVPFGDGRRCIGPNPNGGIATSSVFVINPGGLASFGPGFIAQTCSGMGRGLICIESGQTLYFQIRYRDSNFPPCGTRVNFTNALEITFTP